MVLGWMLPQTLPCVVSFWPSEHVFHQAFHEPYRFVKSSETHRDHRQKILIHIKRRSRTRHGFPTFIMHACSNVCNSRPRLHRIFSGFLNLVNTLWGARGRTCGCVFDRTLMVVNRSFYKEVELQVPQTTFGISRTSDRVKERSTCSSAGVYLCWRARFEFSNIWGVFEHESE